MRYGLNGYEEQTQKETAEILGISQSYISRLEKRILKKMRLKFQVWHILIPEREKVSEYKVNITGLNTGSLKSWSSEKTLNAIKEYKEGKYQLMIL